MLSAVLSSRILAVPADTLSRHPLQTIILCIVIFPASKWRHPVVPLKTERVHALESLVVFELNFVVKAVKY